MCVQDFCEELEYWGLTDLHLVTFLNNGDDDDHDDDDDDIYIMMQCLCVTKNDHFLKRPSVCL